MLVGKYQRIQESKVGLLKAAEVRSAIGGSPLELERLPAVEVAVVLLRQQLSLRALDDADQEISLRCFVLQNLLRLVHFHLEDGKLLAQSCHLISCALHGTTAAQISTRRGPYRYQRCTNFCSVWVFPEIPHACGIGGVAPPTIHYLRANHVPLKRWIYA